MSAAPESSSSVAVGTVITRSYLPFARVLARSLAEQHPDVPCFVVVLDGLDQGAPGNTGEVAEPFTVIDLDELPLTDRDGFRFRYGRQEAVVAAKPFVLQHVLDRGFDRAVYLDVDMLVLGGLDPLLEPEVADGGAPVDIVLTPHLLGPLSAADSARELRMNLAGIYNGGCMSVADSPEGRRFLGWFQERLLRHCRHDVTGGMHYDQRWLDLVPIYFAGVRIERCPGVNVAWWNLPERPIAATGLPILESGEPLRLLHFSGFEPEHPERVTRYVPHLRFDDIGGAAQLFEEYGRLLEGAADPQQHGGGDQFDRFDDGTRIPPIARRWWDQLDTVVQERLGSPFSMSSIDACREWLQESVDEAGAGQPIVLRLWDHVYRSRRDLQLAFRDHLGVDREAFVEWTQLLGVDECGVDPSLLEQPVRR